MLQFKHDQELIEYGNNAEAKAAINRKFEYERTALAFEQAERRKKIASDEAEKEIRLRRMVGMQALGAALAFSEAMISLDRKHKEELKPVLIGIAIARAAAATVAAVQAAWESSGGNYYAGLALSAAAIIENAAIATTQIAAISSAAQGADFVTRGRQLLLVGDNPGGREHVRVTPMSSESGRYNSDISGGVHITITGNADSNTVRLLEERIPAAISKAARSGSLKYALSDMDRYR
jgi:hypothetical protein